MERMIINADLGESEADSVTAALMEIVDAANICCGVHAGGEAKTRRALSLARDCGVSVGAHPGMALSGGRGGVFPGVGEFGELLRCQVGGFRDAADRVGVVVHHLKLHGTLYHAVEQDGGLAEEFMNFLGREVPGMAVLALAGGSFAVRSRAAGLRVIAEAFADRGYLANGGLVPRGQPGALLVDPAAVVERLAQWRASSLMPTVDGGSFPLEAETLCVHADNPQALEILRALRAGGI